MNYAIELKDVNKSFGKSHVLHDIELTIPEGCIYGLLGPSGCGKSTTVRIIAGILGADSGSVFVLGEEMPQRKTLKRIGYMAQSDALYTGLTALENLQFFGAVYGLKGKELQKSIDEVMNLVNLKEDLKKPVAIFSGGMKRRLALAIAILHKPKLLVLDEPTVGIDPVLRQGIWQELNQLVASGTTIIVTTHVMDEAAKCHQLAMMRDGRIIAKGSPAELLASINATDLEQVFLYYGSKMQGGANDAD